MDVSSTILPSRFAEHNINITKLPIHASKVQKANDGRAIATKTADAELKSIVEQPSGRVLMFEDLEEIQKVFGKYFVFNSTIVKGKSTKIEASEFVGSIRNHLLSKNFDPTEFIGYFYKVLDRQLFSWYFSLDSSAKADWKTFSKAFTEEVHRIENNSMEMIHLDLTDFNKKIQTDSNKSKISSYPTYCYLIEKIKLIKLVYPNMPLEYCVSMAVCLLKDGQKIAKYRPLINDLDALLFLAKHDDTTKSS